MGLRCISANPRCLYTKVPVQLHFGRPWKALRHLGSGKSGYRLQGGSRQQQKVALSQATERQD
jgi:hypothetical protein